MCLPACHRAAWLHVFPRCSLATLVSSRLLVFLRAQVPAGSLLLPGPHRQLPWRSVSHVQPRRRCLALQATKCAAAACKADCLACSPLGSAMVARGLHHSRLRGLPGGGSLQVACCCAQEGCGSACITEKRNCELACPTTSPRKALEWAQLDLVLGESSMQMLQPSTPSAQNLLISS